MTTFETQHSNTVETKPYKKITNLLIKLTLHNSQNVKTSKYHGFSILYSVKLISLCSIFMQLISIPLTLMLNSLFVIVIFIQFSLPHTSLTIHQLQMGEFFISCFVFCIKRSWFEGALIGVSKVES